MNECNPGLVRLNKFLSKNSLISRRTADKLIIQGKITVNGEKIKELGIKINPEKDSVFIDGKKIKIQDDKVYYILNKPVGYITTMSDPRGRKKVVDLVPKYPKVYPVGRLDYDSSGLLILTNDGDLTYRLTHPKFEKEKSYEVKCRIMNYESGIMNDKIIVGKFLKGIRLKEGVAKADNVKVLSQKGDIITFNITLHQGWNRQIRRMCATVGLDVISLKRVRIGKLLLGNIKEGMWQKINPKDTKKYFE
ncbi:MAG TPA: pseudouridine synthase [Patescibacteria group bacterium]|nr:pseudouridine synthase [Patescibacteria group bacterium]